MPYLYILLLYLVSDNSTQSLTSKMFAFDAYYLIL
jgi:hypothetical protein